MIAIIGKTCVGKTFILEKAKELGYSTFNCDDFFKEQYKFGNKCYELIKNNFGENYVNGTEVDKKMLRKLVFIEQKKDLLEKLIFPILSEHLEKHKYDFVEIPILYSENGDFERFFNKTLNIVASNEWRRKILNFKNVDNYDFDRYDSINKGLSKRGDVDIYMDNIPIDMDWKNFFKRYYIKII
ncbi:MAG: dephospho-CoA kinase [Metamycoplasmataceae bacterium]